MSLDWYNENANRAYPFIINNNKLIGDNEILDCGFYLKNHETVDVWLKDRIVGDSSVTYVFTYDNCPDDLVFTSDRSSEWSCVWDENDYWYGFCVIGADAF